MKAVFSVLIDGSDISTRLAPVVTSISVSDKAGMSSDTASIDVDDREGRIVLPRPGASITIMLGFTETGMGVVFRGKVDEVRSRGDRGGGRSITVSAKGVDTQGKAKEPQQKHWDEKSLQDILSEAGRLAGIDDVRVDQSFASIIRKYERMDDESFLSFGERIAAEIGGTFKISDGRAVLAKRNGGTTPGGSPLPTVSAVYGQNLHSWDIAPFLSRPRYKQTRTRYYDREAATWKEVLTETVIEDAEAIASSRFTAADEDEAKQKTESQKADAERGSGAGTVVIEGNIGAQPEGLCVVGGTRAGIDGTYRIDGVQHAYSRGGFITTLSLKQPQGTAGKDDR
ncbi:phage late control D family protein [Pararhizobium haloflavum]|uniref:phage late control D family protein n=1 Tax=Pararhizobium haloflavum TaxID=2037914 RepID=UPI000C187353|nr:contractile injection system protein, VgrG/Pvc8 family [Pararhizobium haloflavum]